jgi:hypothetical protein
MWRDRLQFDRKHRLDLGRGCEPSFLGQKAHPCGKAR